MDDESTGVNEDLQGKTEFLLTALEGVCMNRCRDENGKFISSHGCTNTKLYGVWCAMKERCNNPHHKSFRRYGGRGITVCEEWANSFDTFKKWAYENGYKEGLTIDRIDFNGSYSPENCRFATWAEQNRNYSKNVLITYKGKTKCLCDWADEFGINRTTIMWRIKQGKTIEEVFSKTDGRSTRWQKTILQS